MNTEITRIMSASSETLVEAHNISITLHDLDTLHGINWLNDEIINFYLEMIVERSRKNHQWPKVFAMDTFFAPKLYKSGFGGLTKWRQMIDLNDQDLILVPINVKNKHWSLASIDFRKKSLNLYDSMGYDNHEKIVYELTNYLQEKGIDSLAFTRGNDNFAH